MCGRSFCARSLPWFRRRRGVSSWWEPARRRAPWPRPSRTRLLLAAGANINQLNTVRKHCSVLKGRQLARAAAPARVEALLLSDVIGDPLDVIASGPTTPDVSTFTEALAILDRFHLRE